MSTAMVFWSMFAAFVVVILWSQWFFRGRKERKERKASKKRHQSKAVKAAIGDELTDSLGESRRAKRSAALSVVADPAAEREPLEKEKALS